MINMFIILTVLVVSRLNTYIRYHQIINFTCIPYGTSKKKPIATTKQKVSKNILKKSLAENGACACLATCESLLPTRKYAEELSPASATLFLTFLTMTYYSVTEYLTVSGLTEPNLILTYSLRGYNPPWQDKHGMGKHGCRSEAAGCVAFAVVAGIEWEVERGYYTPSLALSDPFPSARLHLLKVPQPSQIVPKVTDQGFRHVSLWGHFTFSSSRAITV